MIDEVYFSSNYLSADWTARKVMADIAGMTVNDPTNTLTTRIIFGNEKNPQAGCVKFNKLLNDKELKDAYMRYIREDVTEMYKRGIKKVIFNPPATIVFWNDDSKTVVKAKNEPYDWEKGLAMCIAKKCYGNLGNYYNVFKKYKDEGEAKTKEANDGVSV